MSLRHSFLATTISLFSVLAVAAEPPSFKLEFEVAGMSCETCAATATNTLKTISGVTRASVDFASKRGRIESRREVTREEVRRALGSLGFEARFIGDAVVKGLTAAEQAGLDIAVASRGEAFDVRKHLAPGKFTVFDFWAEWCGPCHLLTPKLQRLVLDNPDVALRSVEISNWESPVAKQATREFKLPGLPYVRVYGPEGKFLGHVSGNDVEAVKQIIAGARPK